MKKLEALIDRLVVTKMVIEYVLCKFGATVCRYVYYALTIFAGKDKITESAITRTLKGTSKSIGRGAICIAVLGLFALSAYNESLGGGPLVTSAYDIPKRLVCDTHQEKVQKASWENEKRIAKGQRAIYKYNQAIRSSYTDRELREIQTFGPTRGSRY